MGESAAPQGPERPSDSTREPSFPLAELPEDCLAAVLAHCSPLDLGRFACVSRNWQAAAQSEQAWPMIGRWRGLLGAHFAALRASKPPPGVFLDVVKGVRSDDDRYLVRADVASGALSLSVSVVKNCGIAWLDTSQETGYWAVADQVPGADFPTCAQLKSVCWFSASGNLSIPFQLPAGRYLVSWSVAKVRGEFRWSSGMATCSVAMPGENRAIDEVAVDFQRPGRPKESKTPAAFLGSQMPPREGPGPVLIAREGAGLTPATAAPRREGNFTRPATHAARPWALAGRLLQTFLGRPHQRPEGEEEDEEGGEDEGSQLEGAWYDGEEEENRRYAGWEAETEKAGPWQLYDAGVIDLAQDEDAPGLARLEASVDLKEITSGWWKSGLFLDSIVFSPC